MTREKLGIATLLHLHIRDRGRLGISVLVIVLFSFRIDELVDGYQGILAGVGQDDCDRGPDNTAWDRLMCI
ncbi:hypothetical protein M426DRAFT_106454 [Hypoxylon sp. CI-4A]|nr:hypothetical protein M426DRAFT_106454 [Hypoxylon sp. CI-4A]